MQCIQQGNWNSLVIMPEVQAWAGWPVGWETPLWNGATHAGRLVSTLWTCIDLNTRQLASFPVYGMKGCQDYSPA